MLMKVGMESPKSMNRGQLLSVAPIGVVAATASSKRMAAVPKVRSRTVPVLKAALASVIEETLE